MKIFLNLKLFIILLISIILGISNIKIQEKRFNSIYKANEKLTLIAKVDSDIEETEDGIKFTIKIIKNTKYKNTKLQVYIKEKANTEYGDIVKVEGTFQNIDSYKNSGVFNLKEYLKKEKIYGNLKINNLEILNKSKTIKSIFFKIRKYIKEKYESSYSSKTKSYLEVIILGEKSNLEEETKNNFKEGGISHILAISGMHISIIILVIKKVLDKLIKSQKKKYIVLIILLIIYSQVINFSSSAIRSIIMAILHIIAKAINKKDNFLVNLSLSSLVILIINPYNLIDSGFQLSFLATLSLVKILPKIRNSIIQNKILKYIYTSIIVSISANILILPIIIKSFKKFSISMYLVQIFIIPFLYAIEIIGLITIVVPKKLIFMIKPILEISVLIFDEISKIHFFTIYQKVPSIIEMIIYYIFVLLFIIKVKRKIIKKFLKEVLIISILICMLINLTNISKKELEIYMIDVGQGDGILIKTPQEKNILIDGGGNEKYDIGENVLIPYLLNKKIKKIDYIIITHFDSDHVKGIFKVLKKLNVKNVIISKQKEDSENFQEFLKIIRDNKTNIIIVKAEDKIQIEKDIVLEIFWPSEKIQIADNALNNNSIVGKIIYNKFSILFTGDIEEKAEKAILEKYKNNQEILKSTILKIAHHGSKTSSTIEFLSKVNPRIAIIGVGENNNFGHPSIITLKKLKIINCEVFRTDQDGEITIKIKNKKMKVTNIKMSQKRIFDM